MAVRVTKAVTKNGRVYAVGDVIDTPTSVEQSLARLFKWETVSDSTPVSGLRKPELVQLAEDGGLDVAGLTKAEIVQLLEG
jgi:hypothetical protein